MSAGGSRARLLNLLKGAATLEIVREFLKQRGLTSTASSWDQMIEDRLVPHLEERTLAVEDLVSLLRDSEEHGRQHVFLYRITEGYEAPSLNERRLRAALEALDLVNLLDGPRFLELPTTPQIVDVRAEERPRSGVVIKVVERREFLEFVGQNASDGELTKRYRTVEERAVNVARVGRDGLVEVRIFRRRNSTDYAEPLATFQKVIKPLLDLDKCEELSLMKAKAHIWNKGAQISDRIRINQQWARNPFGAENRILMQDSLRTLTDDNGSVRSMHAFVAQDGQHTACHATWVFSPGPPEEARHVALNGGPHEYALGQACTRAQYEQILEDILRFNA
jgi:hypothetical protein